MRDLDFYQAAIEAVNAKDDVFDNIEYGDVTLEVNGETFVLNKDNIVINGAHLEDIETRVQTVAFSFEPDDEFAIFIEGTYDSWEGTDWSDPLIGRVLTKTVVVKEIESLD